MQTIANSLPRVSYTCSLAHLSDGELLAGTRRVVGRSNQLLAELLAHLGEVEARGIHRTRACASLYTYCVHELRFSEDEAFRRVAAARLVRRFPALLDALASGELHLTGLLLIGPHLTPDNLAEVLARSKHRTKREILRLVRILDPMPAVPARIEPLGPAPARPVPASPTWEDFMLALCPVRNLAPDERPRAWLESANECDPKVTADGDQDALAATLPPAPAPDVLPATSPAPDLESRAPERFKVQFTATEEYVHLVEQANALLSHAHPRVTFEELQLRAMRALVTELTKKKYGAPRNTATAAAPGARPPQPEATKPEQEKARGTEPRGRQHAERPKAPSELPAPQHDERSSASEPRPHQQDERTTEPSPRRRGRYVPAAVRRAVLERDGKRCTYIAATGERCIETQRLEFHHLSPFASGGEHTLSNLALRCASHNALAAEEDFGRPFMETKIRASSSRSPNE